MRSEVDEWPSSRFASLKEFFRDALHDALSHQHVAVEGETEHYVVNVLTHVFRHGRALRAAPATRPRPRTRLKPLAMMLGEALEAPDHRGADSAACSASATCRCSSRGSSPRGSRASSSTSTTTSPMGGQAYGTLAESCPTGARRTLRQVFRRSSPSSFSRWSTRSTRSARAPISIPTSDRLRLYELWVKTGSERSRWQLLRKLGHRARARRPQRAGALTMSSATPRRCRVRSPRSTTCRRRPTCRRIPDDQPRQPRRVFDARATR